VVDGHLSDRRFLEQDELQLNSTKQTIIAALDHLAIESLPANFWVHGPFRSLKPQRKQILAFQGSVGSLSLFFSSEDRTLLQDHCSLYLTKFYVKEKQ
jgi:hypothetical protein